MLSFSWNDKSELYDDDSEVLKLDFFISDSRSNSDFQKSDFVSVFDNSNHIFVESDNYPFLKRTCDFLQNKINLIYIDPPYNTGNNFAYNDDFSTSEDKHSAWLSFMQRRLLLARKILSESGCIFIAIDQSELYTLKLLCDQIFGEENFVNDFMWLHGKGKKDKWSRTLQQHTLCFAKNKKKLLSFTDVQISDWAKTNADNDERGNWFSGSISFTEQRSNPNHKNYYEITSPSGKVWRRQWQVSFEEMQTLLHQNKIYFGKAPDYNQVPRVKIFNSEKKEIIPKNIIDSVDSTRFAQNYLDDLLQEKGLFDNPKPVDLIEHLIKITQMPKDSIIMDFFAGSGTTLEAVENLNKSDNGTRRCILVQKPEINSKNPSVTISEICQKRIKKVTSESQNVTFVKLS